MRNIFIWDIHGCYDEFMLLIKKLDIQSDDMVYLVWDLINKWPKSYKVLKFAYKHQNQYKAILWNNEVDFLWAIDGENNYYWEFRKLIKKIKKKQKQELIQYVRELPAYIDTENFLMIHGWLIPEKKLSKHSLAEITNLRNYKWKPWHSYYSWDKKIIYGHWAVQWLYRTHNTVWLDSGCVYGKQLTAYILETDELIQQKALKVHNTIWKTKIGKMLYRIKWYLGLIT